MNSDVKMPGSVYGKGAGLPESIIERLKTENVHAVIADIKKDYKDIRPEDIVRFFAGQERRYRGEVIQDQPITSEFASNPAPEINQMAVHHGGATLSEGESQFFSRSMLNFRAQSLGEEIPEGAATNGPPTREGNEEIAREFLGEWEQFMADTWYQIIDAQTMADYKAKSREVEQEIERIKLLGDPALILIALTKLVETKNGILMVGLGKKAFHVNESMNNIARDLNKKNLNAGEMQLASSQQREGAQQMQLLMTDMQKLMQDTASAFDFAKGGMELLKRGQDQVNSNMAKV